MLLAIEKHKTNKTGINSDRPVTVNLKATCSSLDI